VMSGPELEESPDRDRSKFLSCRIKITLVNA
jgi:hypothetical protein